MDGLMANSLMTDVEVSREIVLPFVEAFKADWPAIEDDARKAFARGDKVYRETYCGLAIELRPENIKPTMTIEQMASLMRQMMDIKALESEWRDAPHV